MIDKIIRLGTIRDHETRPMPVFCHVQYDGKELSITGVEGPKPDGNARGSCGQIVMSLKATDFVTFAPGWSLELVDKFLATWDEWHLNDMRAGCAHQRAENWGSESVEVATYGLTTAARQEVDSIKKRAMTELIAGGTTSLTPQEQALCLLPWERFDAPDADAIASGRYEVKKRDTKNAGHTYPAEHPGGVLCKPCPTCGHKYGSKWLFEPVPDDVLAFLSSLPDTDMKPAWV